MAPKGRDAAVALFFLSNQTLPKLFQAAKGAVDGALLGAASSDLLHAVDERYYATQPKYTDDGYNSGGLLEWEKGLIKAHFPAAGHLAVTGAGGGREVLALLERGYEVTGHECNPRLVDAANCLLEARGHPRVVRVAPRDRWVDEGRRYDAVVVGWGAYMLMTGRSRRVAFLRGARAQLAPGVPILLSFYDRSGDSPYFKAVRKVGNPIRWLRGAEWLTAGDGLAPNYVHYFTEQDLADELREGGLDLVAYQAGDYGRAVARVPCAGEHPPYPSPPLSTVAAWDT